MENYKDIIEKHPDEIWRITDRVKVNGLWKVVNLPGEVWKTIPFATLYQASNYGRIKAVNAEKWGGKILFFQNEHCMAFGMQPSGYLIVSLITNDGKRKTYRVNRVILKTFKPNKSGLSDACHINGIKQDNRLTNLKWGSHTFNMSDAQTRKRISESMGFNVECTEMKFSSIKDAAKFYNIPYTKMLKWLTGDKPMPKEWKDRGLQILKD